LVATWINGPYPSRSSSPAGRPCAADVPPHQLSFSSKEPVSDVTAAPWPSVTGGSPDSRPLRGLTSPASGACDTWVWNGALTTGGPAVSVRNAPHNGALPAACAPRSASSSAASHQTLRLRAPALPGASAPEGTSAGRDRHARPADRSRSSPIPHRTARAVEVALTAEQHRHGTACVGRAFATPRPDRRPTMTASAFAWHHPPPSASRYRAGPSVHVGGAPHRSDLRRGYLEGGQPGVARLSPPFTTGGDREPVRCLKAGALETGQRRLIDREGSRHRRTSSQHPVRAGSAGLIVVRSAIRSD